MDKEKIECLICHKMFRRITNTHLAQAHGGLTMKKYLEKFPGALVDSADLKEKRASHFRGKTYEEIFGREKGKSLRQLRRETTKKAWDGSPERKEKMSKQLLGVSKSSESIQKQKSTKRKKDPKKYDANHYRERALDFYGNTCARCGGIFSSKELVVHHRDLVNIPGSIGHHQIDNLMVLCKKCHAKLHNQLQDTMRQFTGLSDVERGMYYILKGLRDELGLDVTTEHFKDTPKRVARAYAEIFSGVQDTEQQVQSILSTSFSSDLDDMMVVRDIEVFSMCPHHFLPVVYKIDIGYLPNGQILGLSKLPRVAEILAKRPVVQEDLAIDIADALMSIQPKGVGVRIQGCHFCMGMRGVKKPGSSAITSAMRGAFLHDPSVRQEFISLCKS